MTMMRHSDIEELLGAYALDALEGQEADAVELHLRDCPRCRAEVAGHRETAALLAFGGGEAPPGIWERIQASLEEAPPKLELARVVPLPQSRFRSRMVNILTAAALIISVVASGVALTRTTSAGGGEVALDRQIAEMAADPATRTVHLVEAGGSVRADVLLAEDGGFLVQHSLPKLPPGQTYQLWGQQGDVKVSLGVLGAEPKRMQFASAGRYENLAITVERDGGAPQPTGAAVVAGWVPPR